MYKPRSLKKLISPEEYAIVEAGIEKIGEEEKNREEEKELIGRALSENNEKKRILEWVKEQAKYSVNRIDEKAIIINDMITEIKSAHDKVAGLLKKLAEKIHDEIYKFLWDKLSDKYKFTSWGIEKSYKWNKAVINLGWTRNVPCKDRLCISVLSPLEIELEFIPEHELTITVNMRVGVGHHNEIVHKKTFDFYLYDLGMNDYEIREMMKWIKDAILDGFNKIEEQKQKVKE